MNDSKSLRRSVDFKERFKGKTSTINKEGHVGVAMDTHNAIDKSSSP